MSPVLLFWSTVLLVILLAVMGFDRRAAKTLVVLWLVGLALVGAIT